MGMDTVELVMALEEAFQIAIPDEEAEKISTPHHVIDFIMSRLEGEQTSTVGVKRWSREEVASKVREITIEQLAITPDQYHEDARFIEDFGAD